MITSSINNGVMQVMLNRPAQKNALNLEMYAALASCFTQADTDDAVRVVVISGNGGNFSSGNDVAEFKTVATAMQDSEFSLLQFMHALKDCRKPVIAAVEGYAIGIGMTMLLHCDVVYASSNATFKLPFATLGLCPEYASSYLLPLMVGHLKASEWLLLGEGIAANSALQAGVINDIVDNPLDIAQQKAQQIALLPPQAIQTSKALLKAAHKNTVEATMQNEIAAFIKALQGKEFAEAATAFKEKRPADFSKL